MTPKEKAKELVDKYNFLKAIFIPSIHEQKQCALIAVDEILNSRPSITDSQVEYQNFWQEVKQEINKLQP